MPANIQHSGRITLQWRLFRLTKIPFLDRVTTCGMGMGGRQGSGESSNRRSVKARATFISFMANCCPMQFLYRKRKREHKFRRKAYNVFKQRKLILKCIIECLPFHKVPEGCILFRTIYSFITSKTAIIFMKNNIRILFMKETKSIQNSV